MFLVILEDGSILKQATVNADDLINCEEGYLNILDVSEGNNPLEYYQSAWHAVAEL